jgi:hypothetical protein
MRVQRVRRVLMFTYPKGSDNFREWDGRKGTMLRPVA